MENVEVVKKKILTAFEKSKNDILSIKLDYHPYEDYEDTIIPLFWRIEEEFFKAAFGSPDPRRGDKSKDESEEILVDFWEKKYNELRGIEEKILEKSGCYNSLT